MFCQNKQANSCLKKLSSFSYTACAGVPYEINSQIFYMMLDYKMKKKHVLYFT